MIVRLVKMTFVPHKVDNFLEVFNGAMDKIRAFEGCRHMELLNDTGAGNIFFTYSIWDKEESLENYRNSELFINTWSKVKILFAEKPQAWSLKKAG